MLDITWHWCHTFFSWVLVRRHFCNSPPMRSPVLALYCLTQSSTWCYQIFHGLDFWESPEAVSLGSPRWIMPSPTESHNWPRSALELCGRYREGFSWTCWKVKQHLSGVQALFRVQQETSCIASWQPILSQASWWLGQGTESRTFTHLWQ